MKRIVCTLNIFTIIMGNAFATAPPFVYRGDTRSLGDIFANGFSAGGTNLNIIQHVIGGYSDENSSGYVSTSDNEFIAAALGSVFVAEDHSNPGHSQPYLS